MRVRYAVLLSAWLPCTVLGQEVYATVTPFGGFEVYLVPDEQPKRQRPAQRRPQASPEEAAWGRALKQRPSARLPALADQPTRAPAKVNGDYQQRLTPAIARIAGQYGLDPRLIHAVISAESAFDWRAVSPTGAMGLMQLMPDTAQRLGVHDPFDPLANLDGGARYLRGLLDQFRDTRLALAAYNAGEGTVMRYGNAIPPYPETQRYVQRVLAFYRSYQQ